MNKICDQSYPVTSDLPDIDGILADEPPTIHFFPRDTRYRRSGATRPMVGDITLCGVVKQRPPDDKRLGKPVTCVACARLLKLMGDVTP